jgi:hypothetical protein
MKVEASLQLPAPTTPIDDLPVIKADQIRNILYLGVRGNIRLPVDGGQTVDTYA